LESFVQESAIGPGIKGKGCAEARKCQGVNPKTSAHEEANPHHDAKDSRDCERRTAAERIRADAAGKLEKELKRRLNCLQPKDPIERYPTVLKKYDEKREPNVEAPRGAHDEVGLQAGIWEEHHFGDLPCWLWTVEKMLRSEL
jgi:hypothetical protein